MATEIKSAPDSTPLVADKTSTVVGQHDEKPGTAAMADTSIPDASENVNAEPTSAADTAATTAAVVAATKTSVSPIQDLWAAAKANGHPEIWGVTLADPDTHVPTQIVLQKYLNANDGDLAKASDQLLKTLEWRAKTKPLELLKKTYSKSKFDGLGYVTAYNDKDVREVFTWNVYGNTTSIEDTFGKLDEFIEWRVALMELALQDLSISTATTPITANDDPYKIFQVHDYKSISFFRSPPSVKSASSETIKVFAQNYPELLKEKFFVNVPAIMGFMYTFMKLFVAAKTIKKFHPMSNGGNLAFEFTDSKIQGLGERLPKEYGGKGPDLKTEPKGIALA